MFSAPGTQLEGGPVPRLTQYSLPSHSFPGDKASVTKALLSDGASLARGSV